MNNKSAEQGRTRPDAIGPLLTGCQHCLEQYEALLAEVQDIHFNTCNAQGSSVSAHIRHVLERFLSVLNGMPSGQINYDDRRRDPTLENNPQAAIFALASIRRRLDELSRRDLTETVAVQESVHPAMAPVRVNSTLARELMGLVSHSVHHLAIISVLLRSLGYRLDPELGKAASTLISEAR